MRVAEGQWERLQFLARLVHEYIEDPAILCSALQAGHDFVPVLMDTAKRLTAQIDKLAPNTSM